MNKRLIKAIKVTNFVRYGKTKKKKIKYVGTDVLF